MVHKFRVVFYPRTNYVTKDKKSPIDIRLYLDGQRIPLGATGLFVNPKNWDSKCYRVIGRNYEAVNINAELARIEADLGHIFRRHEFDENLTLDLIRAEYKGERKETKSFLKFYEEHLEEIEKQVGKDRSKASFQKYSSLLRHFKEFIFMKYKRREYMMNELTFRTISDFETYLLTVAKCSNNTVMKMLGTFKSVTIKAQKMGVLDHDPFVNFKFRFKKVDRGFLSDEEIQRIMSKEFDIPRLELVRDIFIFSCFTGLAYIDVANLRESNIVVMDGRPWIITKRQKTEVEEHVLLLDIPLQIIEKYKGQDKKGRLFPILSNQKMNSYLKEIGALCGILKNLTFHLGRHSFATMALTKGVPMESVSKMLGHTNLRTTMNYARITNKKVEMDMLFLASKLENFNSDEITRKDKDNDKKGPKRGPKKK